MTPTVRFVRTATQVLLAVLAAVPAAVTLLDDLETALAAKIVGLAGAAVILISAAQNAWESSTGKTLGGDGE